MGKPILLISKPIGHKRGEPIVGFPSRLVDPETRLPIDGVGQITLNIPVKGMLTCTAQVSLGGIEIIAEDVRAGDKAVGAKVEAAEAAGLRYTEPPLVTSSPEEKQ